MSELENGRKHPSAEMADHLDKVLEAGGALSGLVSTVPGVLDHDQSVVRHALAHPERLDPAAVDAFAALLATERRLDDMVAAHSMLPWVVPQYQVVHQAARESRGPHADRLRLVAAEWTQFVAWLYAEARLDAPAVELLEQARAEARELGDGELEAQSIDFRGWLARHRGEHRTAARAYSAMVAVPGATVAQRINGLTHAAHSLGSSGNRRDAEQMLSQARDLLDDVDEPPDTAYWLSPTFLRLGVGIALAALDDRHGAAQQLQAGLDGLPPIWAQAEWATEYRAALDTVTS